jgi:eukaryotic-like serine/threonine-protein kinase
VNASASSPQWDAGNDPVVTPLGPDDPRQIGRFEIKGLLGAGGMGEVYLGVADGQYAAVKLIRHVVTSERFEREIDILRRVPVGVGPQMLAHDSTAPRPWFAVEYIPGVTLEQAVHGSGPLPSPLPSGALWLLLARTAAQLRKIHQAGIVHRDLKPANVMLVPDGVKLIDFGIALDGAQERLTRNGAGCGTPGFQPKEQRRGGGRVTKRVDVYALGAMLVYAASGSAPDPGSGLDVKPLRRVDEALADVAKRCLADRFWARPITDRLVKKARARELAGHLCWPQEVTSRIKAREDFVEGLRTKEVTVPPENKPGPSPGGPVKRLPSVMIAAGVTAGIASAIVTGVVYGTATVLESGLGAGLRVALVNGTVNGIGAGLTFGLLHAFAARFTAGRPVSGPSRPPDASRFTAFLLMVTIGMVIGAGYGLALGPVPGLAAGLMAAVGAGTMTAWGRWLVLARIRLPLSCRVTGKR